MKRIGLICLTILMIVGSLAGCNVISEGADKDRNNDISQGTDNDKVNDLSDNQVFQAIVISNKNGLLVSSDEESMEYLSSDKMSVGLLETEIYGQDDNLIDEEILEPGDRVKIFYNGIIAESYPAQISAKKIEVVGHNDIIDGMFALIDDIYQEDSALNSDISMIALDTSEWTSILMAEIYTILAMVEEKYEVEIIQGTYEELAERGLIDEENLYFESGILITLRDIKINKGRDKISTSISKWRSGLGAIGWDGEAKLKAGEWKITRDNMWIS